MSHSNNYLLYIISLDICHTGVVPTILVHPLRRSCAYRKNGQTEQRADKQGEGYIPLKNFVCEGMYT